MPPALEFLGDGRFEHPLMSVVGRVYRARHDGPFTFADGEVIAAEWVTRAALDDLLRQRDWCPDSVALALPLLP